MDGRRRARARRAWWLVWPLLRLIIGGLIRSWRLRVVGDAAALDPETDASPVIFAFWHGDLVACGGALQRRLVRKGRAITALVSRSADGEIVARAAADFGYSTVRGSTSRGGLAALRGLRTALVRDRRSVVVVPDGPRGPARRAKAGAVRLAVLGGAPIVPMAASVSRGWRLGSWDRMVIPAPFARVTLAVGRALIFDRDSIDGGGADLLEAQLRELEELARAESK